MVSLHVLMMEKRPGAEQTSDLPLQHTARPPRQTPVSRKPQPHRLAVRLAEREHRLGDILRRVVNQPEVPPHEFAKGVFRAVLGVAAEQSGVIVHRVLRLAATRAKTEQPFSTRLHDRRRLRACLAGARGRFLRAHSTKDLP